MLLHVDEPDLIRHGPDMPVVTGPDDSQDAASHGLAAPGTDVRIVGAVDTWDPASPVGPPELFVWLRLPGRAGGPAMAQALLSYATDGFLIGTAMRPHPGFGQNMAHRSVSTGVVSHTLTFHEPIETGRWLLVAHECPYAGRGRTYGRAHVFTEDGRLVASFVQENLVRGAAPGGSGVPQHRCEQVCSGDSADTARVVMPAGRGARRRVSPWRPAAVDRPRPRRRPG